MGTAASPALSGMGVGRNTNAFVANTVDQEPYLYWDAGCLTAVAGAQLFGTYFAFSIPIGQPNPALPTVGGNNQTQTKLQTNMQTGNQFPPPRCLLLNAICFQYASNMLKADIDAIENGAYFEFKIADKIFYEGYLRDCPAGAGLQGVSTNNGESVYTNGWATPAGRRTFGSWSKYIPPLTRFSLNIIFNGSNNIVGGNATPPTMTASGSGGTGMNIRIVLDGITALPVQ
jgi:hypothetical protein